MCSSLLVAQGPYSYQTSVQWSRISAWWVYDIANNVEYTKTHSYITLKYKDMVLCDVFVTQHVDASDRIGTSVCGLIDLEDSSLIRFHVRPDTVIKTRIENQSGMPIVLRALTVTESGDVHDVEGESELDGDSQYAPYGVKWIEVGREKPKNASMLFSEHIASALRTQYCVKREICESYIHALLGRRPSNDEWEYFRAYWTEYQSNKKLEPRYVMTAQQHRVLLRKLKGVHQLVLPDVNKKEYLNVVNLSNTYINVDGVYYTTECRKIACELPALDRLGQRANAWRLYLEEFDGVQQQNLFFVLKFENI